MNRKNSTRGYDMRTRAVSAETTRRRIVDEAQKLFLARWYDDVTLAAIADAAGVSGQTILNHFGDKEGVFAAVIENASGELVGRRDRAVPGDVAGAIEILVDDYEITGDANVRMLALEERVDAVREPMERGRRGHREWIERIFEAPAATSELLIVTDVYAWKLLRRDQGLSRDETVAVVQRMVETVLANQPLNDKKSKRRSK